MNFLNKFILKDIVNAFFFFFSFFFCVKGVNALRSIIILT